MGPQIGASRPPALLQRRGRISGTRGIPARRSHSRGRIAALGPAPTNERLSGRGETGRLARTQGGREPQRGSMPVRSTDEDSRPTEDNARSGLKNGEPAFPDRLAWGLDTRKSPTAQDRSACLRLFETTSRRPVSRQRPSCRTRHARGRPPRLDRPPDRPSRRGKADQREAAVAPAQRQQCATRRSPAKSGRATRPAPLQGDVATDQL